MYHCYPLPLLKTRTLRLDLKTTTSPASGHRAKWWHTSIRPSCCEKASIYPVWTYCDDSDRVAKARIIILRNQKEVPHLLSPGRALTTTVHHFSSDSWFLQQQNKFSPLPHPPLDLKLSISLCWHRAHAQQFTLLSSVFNSAHYHLRNYPRKANWPAPSSESGGFSSEILHTDMNRFLSNLLTGTHSWARRSIIGPGEWNMMVTGAGGGEGGVSKVIRWLSWGHR